jgi:hypothetical protein
MKIDLDAILAAQRASMRAAGEELRECHRVLEKAGLNVVSEVLRGQGEFVELAHYPCDDVFDTETFGQYYYHAHRGNDAEHGHFHLFLRAGGMPAGSAPIDYPSATEPWPQGEDGICHLIAVSMDAWGAPIGLFCTNRWVTDEAWYPAEQVIAMLEHFAIDHAFPNWSVNRWLTAMVRLYRPHIEALMRQRDEVVAAWQREHPGEDVFEDRRLDITGYLPISPSALIAELGE